MASRIGGLRGGILGLLELIDEHQEAIEYELLTIGRHLNELSSPALSWRDLYVLLRRWQKTPGNAVAASLAGTEVPSWTDQILAVIVDLQQATNFLLRKGKGQRPKRLLRWWEKHKQQRLGRDPIPLSQFDAWWDAASRK